MKLIISLTLIVSVYQFILVPQIIVMGDYWYSHQPSSPSDESFVNSFHRDFFDQNYLPTFTHSYTNTRITSASFPTSATTINHVPSPPLPPLPPPIPVPPSPPSSLMYHIQLFQPTSYIQLPSQQSAESECALILRRTYVQPKDMSQVLGTGEVCIRYTDVDDAISQAKNNKNYIRPNDMESLEPAVTTIDTTGELALETSRVLAIKFKLSPDEILNGLPLIDMSKTNLWSECPSNVKPYICTAERFRTYTGHCNNLKHPSWGASYTPFVRYMPPVYGNGEF